MENAEDALLVAEILDGSVHRYTEVVRRYDREVRSVLRRGARDPGEVEELVQETFYLAFRDLANLRSPAELRAWILTIARRRLADRRRRPKIRLVSLHADRDLSTDSVPDPKQHEWLWDEVAALPDEQAQVLRLHYSQDLSYQQVAAALGVPVSTIRGRLYEARRALRQRLART